MKRANNPRNTDVHQIMARATVRSAGNGDAARPGTHVPNAPGTADARAPETPAQEEQRGTPRSSLRSPASLEPGAGLPPAWAETPRPTASSPGRALAPHPAGGASPSGGRPQAEKPQQPLLLSLLIMHGPLSPQNRARGTGAPPAASWGFLLSGCAQRSPTHPLQRREHAARRPPSPGRGSAARRTPPSKTSALSPKPLTERQFDPMSQNAMDLLSNVQSHKGKNGTTVFHTVGKRRL